MISRITKRMQVRGEGGFTLIELLVVIIIIAILAAIAIPMYLSQRTKGWNANIQSDLRNAAVAQESYFTDSTPSKYTILLTDLTGVNGVGGEGYNKSTNINLVLVTGTSFGYCMQAEHLSNPGVWYVMNSAEGNPQPGTCL